MNLYLISQTENDGYDTYDSAVVAAESESDARNVTPDGRPLSSNEPMYYNGRVSSPNKVTAHLIGTASPDIEAGAVICASFNAG